MSKNIKIMPATMVKITDKVKELKELKAMAKELDKEIEKIEEELKNELLKRDIEELDVGAYIVRYTKVLSDRLDTKKLKEDMPNVYKTYLKQTASRRFTISD